MSLNQLSFILLSWTLFFSCPLVSSLTNNNDHNENNNPTAASYGVDVSFPIHHQTVSTNYAWLPHNIDPKNNPTPPEYQNMPIQPLGNRQKVYDEFIQGCKNYYGHRKEACTQTEYDRVVMSKRQPSSMQNYTDTGFKKIRMPDTLWKLLKTFWDKNKENKVLEQWTAGNTYTNHWAAPTYMVSVENSSLRGGGSVLKQAIWDAAKETIEEWTGQALTQCSLYGIRIYTEGKFFCLMKS
jgi:prolyl 4-hydroxylase